MFQTHDMKISYKHTLNPIAQNCWTPANSLKETLTYCKRFYCSFLKKLCDHMEVCHI